jgi:hypothetical protein
MAGAAAGGNLNANRRPAPGSGMRPAATIEDGPVLRGQTKDRVTLRPKTQAEVKERDTEIRNRPSSKAFGRQSSFDRATPEEQAHLDAMRVFEQTPRGQRERQERKQTASTTPVITPGEEGTVVDRKIPQVDRGPNHAWNEDALVNAINRTKGRYPTSNRIEQAEQARTEAGAQKWAEDKVKEQGPLNAENENARRQGQNPIREERTRERGRKENEKYHAADRVKKDAEWAEYEARLAADQAKATEDLKFAKQDANSVAEREAQSAFGKAQDRKEAVRVQAAKDKANFEENPVNPKTGEKQFPTDADGAPMFTAEQLAKRSGIKGGTPEAGPVSQALADKQANKKALVEAANKGDIDAVDKLLAESKAIDARARAAEEKSKTVVDKAGAQGAGVARDLAGRVALARQRAGLTFDQTALPLEGATTRKPAKAAPASEPEPQTGIEVLAKPTTGEPIARTQPTARSEDPNAKNARSVNDSAPVEQRAKALKQAPKVVKTTPTDAKKVESTSTPSKPTPKAKTSEDLDKEIAAAIKKSGDTDEQIAAHMRGAGLTDEGFIAKEIKRFRDMNKEPEPVSPPAPAAPKTNAQQVAEDMKKGLEGIGAGAGVAFKSDTAKRLSKALDGRMTFEQVIADMGVEIGGQTGRDSRLVFDLARQRGLKSVDGETFTSLLKEALGHPAAPVPSDRPTIPVVQEAKPRVQTPVKPAPRGAVQKAIAAVTGQDKKPISTSADKPKTVAPKDETADRVKRAKRLRAQADLIEKKPKGKK